MHEFVKKYQYGLDGKTYRQVYRAGRKAFSTHTLDQNPHPEQSPKGWAWEDGMLDENADREMYHLRDCKAHHNEDGGCGKA
jgi:hypothetical protein